MTTFFVTVLAGLAVLVLWRYVQKPLDVVDGWTARSVPTAARRARMIIRPRPGDLGDLVGLVTVGPAWAIFRGLTSGWSDAWVVVPIIAAWTLSGLIQRRSNLAVLVALDAYSLGLASYYGVSEGLAVPLMVFSAATVGATLLLLATWGLEIRRRRRSPQQA